MKYALPRALKNVVNRRASPQARQLVLSLLREEKKPLTVQEIYNLSQPRNVQLPDGSPVLPSMRYLKKVVMSELADAGKVEKVHERLKFTEEEMKALRERMGKQSYSLTGVPLNVELWRWQLKTAEAKVEKPVKPVFGKEVGVGADWSHLNKRRQRAREEKVEKDVQWLRELERARNEVMKSSS